MVANRLVKSSWFNRNHPCGLPSLSTVRNWVESRYFPPNDFSISACVGVMKVEAQIAYGLLLKIIANSECPQSTFCSVSEAGMVDY